MTYQGRKVMISACLQSNIKRKLRTVTYTDLLRFRGAKDIWKDKIPYLIKPQRVKASLGSFEEKFSDQKGN